MISILSADSGFRKSNKKNRCMNLQRSARNLFAERRGFEPLKPFGGLLAFQAGQFNHSCIFPSGCKDKHNFPKSGNFLRLFPVCSEIRRNVGPRCCPAQNLRTARTRNLLCFGISTTKGGSRSMCEVYAVFSSFSVDEK